MGVSKRVMTAVGALMLMAVLALSMTVSPATALAKSDKNTASGGTPVSYMVTGVTTPAPVSPSTPVSSAAPLPVLNDAADTTLWAVVAIVSGAVALFAYITVRRTRRRV